MKNERKCPICGNDKSTFLQKIKMKLIDDIKLPNSYNVVCCNKCGFCYADTIANKNDYDFYYMNCNVYSDMPIVFCENSSKFNYFEKMIQLLLKKNSMLVNIGIGNGIFEQQLYENGYKNIIGIDPSKKSVKKLRDNGIQAYEGSIYDNSYKKYLNKNIEAIFLFDVLEHLLNLDEAMNNLVEVICEGTKLFVTVPNCAAIKRKQTPIPNNFNQEHINYFSKESLDNLLCQYGFKQIYCQTTLEEIYAVYVYNLKNEKYFIKKDTTTINSITEYFFEQKKLIERKTRIINSLVKTQQPTIIWGIGANTMQLFATTELGKCNIKYFIDNNPLKRMERFGGIVIKLPNEVDFRDDYTILISSSLYGEDIKKQAEKINSNMKLILI